MFAGAGLYVDGVMFAIFSKDVIYRRRTTGYAPHSARGLARRSAIRKGGKRAIMSYWRMPERLYALSATSLLSGPNRH